MTSSKKIAELVLVCVICQQISHRGGNVIARDRKWIRDRTEMRRVDLVESSSETLLLHSGCSSIQGKEISLRIEFCTIVPLTGSGSVSLSPSSWRADSFLRQTIRLMRKEGWKSYKMMKSTSDSGILRFQMIHWTLNKVTRQMVRR